MLHDTLSTLRIAASGRWVVSNRATGPVSGNSSGMSSQSELRTPAQPCRKTVACKLAHSNPRELYKMAARHKEAPSWEQRTCKAENDCSSLLDVGAISRRVLRSGCGSNHVQIPILGADDFCIRPKCAKLQPACNFQHTLRKETSPQRVSA